MTEARPVKKPRWSSGKVRALAWATGSATFLGGLGVLGMSPKPATAGGEAAQARQKPIKQKIIIRRITRRVVIVDPPTQTPVYYASGGSSYSGSYSSGSSSSGSSGSSGSSVSAPAPPPPPPPPTGTGGSTP